MIRPFPAPVLRLLSAALLAAATLAVFSGALRNGWLLLDDPVYVTGNPYVTQGLTWSGALWFLHEPQAGNWHPLTSWSHMLDVQLFGLGPGGPHAVNVGFHVVNVLLLLVLLYRLTGAWWPSLFAAAFFALHPLRVESVAWISERKDVLSACFFLLALLAYDRWARRPGALRWSLVIAAFVLGLMAKPMVVTLPFVLVLLDIWPLGRLRGAMPPATPPGPDAAEKRTILGLLEEKWLLFALAAASAIVTYVVQQRTNAVVGLESLAPAQRFANAALSYWRYVGKLVWPAHLAPYYPLDRTPHLAAALAAGMALAGVTILAFRQARRRPYLLVGWLWYVGTLVPVIGLVQVGRQGFADRYTYIPGIGLLVLIVWGVEEATRRARGGRVAAASAGLAALAGLSLVTLRQVNLWRDSLTLFSHTITVARPDYFSHFILGLALADAKRDSAALLEFRRAEALDSSQAETHYQMSRVLVQLGRTTEARFELERVRRQAPGDADLAYWSGTLAVQGGRYREAEKDFRRALALDPGNVSALDRLGVLLAMEGRGSEALEYLRLTAERLPRDPTVQFQLGSVLLHFGGHEAEAAACLRQALRHRPDWVEALNKLAWLVATSPDPAVRDGAEALRLSQRACELVSKPDPSLLDTQAAALAAAGRFDEAVGKEGEAARLAKQMGVDSLARRCETRAAAYARRIALVDSSRATVAPPGLGSRR